MYNLRFPLISLHDYDNAFNEHILVFACSTYLVNLSVIAGIPLFFLQVFFLLPRVFLCLPRVFLLSRVFPCLPRVFLPSSRVFSRFYHQKTIEDRTSNLQ